MFVPSEGPNAGPAPSRELYALMGEDNIRLLLKDFYSKLGASSIAGMFPKNLDQASEKSALFFIGLMGGPPLYMQTYGAPRLRMRHFPFRITPEFRNVWLECFYATLDNSERYQFPSEHLPGFKDFLAGFSKWMVNTEQSQGS